MFIGIIHSKSENYHYFLTFMSFQTCITSVNAESDLSHTTSSTVKQEELRQSSNIESHSELLVLQVPVPLTVNRRRFLVMKWMITECRDNRHRRTHMYEKLSQELLAAFANEGNIVKRKHDLHKMAEANRAYAHYRWW